MKSNVSCSPILVAAAIAAFLVPRPASAFPRGCPTRIEAQPSEADVYEELAVTSLGDRESWPYVARMLEKSASMREACDMRAVAALVLAGRIYHHLGQLEMARLTFITAAERALIAGELAHAAHCFLDAGVIAVDQGYQEAAVEVVLSAHVLRTSLLLDESERQGIARRVVDLRSRTGLGG